MVKCTLIGIVVAYSLICVWINLVDLKHNWIPVCGIYMCLTIVSLSAINGISVGMTTGGHVSFGSDEGPSLNSKTKWKW